MSSRSSFSVFLDTPQPNITQSKSSLKIVETPLSPSTSTNSIINASATTIIEKENLHPLTGERPESSNVISKKRKSSSILATKVHNPLTSKKQKELSSKSKPEAKKRKPSSSSSSSSPSISKSKSISSDKETKRVGSVSRKKSTAAARSSKASSRKVSPMPKLDEELDGLELEQERVRQAMIDSRCYELTVLPLADVTQAYATAPPVDYPSGEEKLSRSVKAKSAEPELRDYYAPSLSSSTSMPSLSNSYSSSISKRGNSTPPMESSQETKIFSTPERKQIYAAFTFTSPSPTSVRIGLTRSTSVDSIHFHRSA